ncbi:hypothetical protein BJ912DRAFT_648274 [Pholiota molesta]|nr:hypothetical protein BJ912DRAFT_648274 [Pholiota molesta]
MDIGRSVFDTNDKITGQSAFDTNDKITGQSAFETIENIGQSAINNTDRSSFDTRTGFTVWNQTAQVIWLQTSPTRLEWIAPGNVSAAQRAFGNFPVRSHNALNAPVYLTVSVHVGNGSMSIASGPQRGRVGCHHNCSVHSFLRARIQSCKFSVNGLYSFAPYSKNTLCCLL